MEESCRYNNVSFIIKRNPRQESKEEWLRSVRDFCMNIQNTRDGKTVYVGQTFRDVTYTLPDQEIIGLYHAHGESEQYHSGA